MTPWLTKTTASTRRRTAGGGPGDVHPEVADRPAAAPGQAPDERHRDREPTAADMKFWKAKPTVWVKKLTVDSGM